MKCFHVGPAMKLEKLIKMWIIMFRTHFINNITFKSFKNDRFNTVLYNMIYKNKDMMDILSEDKPKYQMDIIKETENSFSENALHTSRSEKPNSNSKREMDNNKNIIKEDEDDIKIENSFSEADSFSERNDTSMMVEKHLNDKNILVDNMNMEVKLNNFEKLEDVYASYKDKYEESSNYLFATNPFLEIHKSKLIITEKNLIINKRKGIMNSNEKAIFNQKTSMFKSFTMDNSPQKKGISRVNAAHTNSQKTPQAHVRTPSDYNDYRNFSQKDSFPVVEEEFFKGKIKQFQENEKVIKRDTFNVRDKHNLISKYQPIFHEFTEEKLNSMIKLIEDGSNVNRRLSSIFFCKKFNRNRRRCLQYNRYFRRN